MARQKTIYVTGAIEHLIFYEYRGKPCCRMRPKKVAQTAATRTRGKQFGQAARLSRILRNGLASLLPHTKDKDMLYRLNNAFYQWLRHEQNSQQAAINLPFLQHFPFSTETLLSTICQQPITVSWELQDQVQVTIPGINPHGKGTAPAGTQKLHWKVGICSCPLAENAADSSPYLTTVEIPYQAEGMPAQELVLPFTMQPGAITIVAAALKYEQLTKNGTQFSTDKRWLPAGIIGSCYNPLEG